MNGTDCITGGYSTSQAAKKLGVSQHEVTRLIRSGLLEARKIDAGIYVVDSDSVQRRMRTSRAKGRPWDASTGWAALLLLEGVDSPGIGYHCERRLKAKMAEMSAEELVVLSRKRMQAFFYRCSPSYADDVRSGLSLSGISSPWAEGMGLVLADVSEIDGYALHSKDDIVNECFLVSDPNGGCCVRIASSLPEALQGLDAMPPTVAAADLALSVDDRERRCGLDFLERKLSEYRASGDI